MKNTLFVLCKVLLIISIVFWSIMAVYHSFFKFTPNESYLIIKILLFFEPLLFAIALFGLIKKIKFIYILSVIFVFFNAMLSITDEVGLYDILSLVFNILLFVNLLLVWKQIFKNNFVVEK
ncbi:MAG: hypothetical protein PHC53_02895 [Patescibacteria group bacterium]|nr:hypothetical protein [Patescibacteria group bacterium]